jgi:hypothetical protein
MLAQMRELAPARDRYARAQARGGTARPLALPIAEREEPRVLPQVQIQTNLRYSLSASGRSSNQCEVVLAKQLSLIRRSDAPNRMRYSG